jgi:hypothetical protein
MIGRFGLLLLGLAATRVNRRQDDMSDHDQSPIENPKTGTSTDDLLAVLPHGVADEFGLDPNANQPIFPTTVDVSLADFGKTNPVVWASDWRLLAPPDSDAYRDAIDNPKDINADDDVRQVTENVAKMLLKMPDRSERR